MPSDDSDSRARNPSSREDGYPYRRHPHYRPHPAPPGYPQPQRRVLDRLTEGEPLFSAPPFAEGSGAHLRTLFAFATAPPESSKRSASMQRDMNKLVPLELKKDFGQAVRKQGSNATAVLARYIAAHVELSLSPGSDALDGCGFGDDRKESAAEEKGAESRAAAREALGAKLELMIGQGHVWRRMHVFFSDAPLKDRKGGRRLRELFRFICGPRRTEARRDLDKEKLGLRIPIPLFGVFNRVLDRQRPTATEVLIRYMAAHVHLSDRWS